MADYNQNLLIETPENLTLEAEVAGFGSRSIAALVDYTLILILYIITIIVFAQLAGQSSIDDRTFGVLLILFTFVLFTFYHLAFEFLLNGQTPGKMLVGIRVVQASGMPVTSSGVIIRNLVRTFDFFPLFYGIGLVVMFFSKNAQRLGDFAARTLVVYERPEVSLNSLVDERLVRYRHIGRNAKLPDFIRLDALDERDQTLLWQYLRRRNTIAYPDSLSYQLANRFSQKMGLEQQSVNMYSIADQFLEQIARGLERDDAPASLPISAPKTTADLFGDGMAPSNLSAENVYSSDFDLPPTIDFDRDFDLGASDFDSTDAPAPSVEDSD